VKPVNTQELLRQIEALLISHQDHKTRAAAGHVVGTPNPINSKKASPVAAAGEKAL
jgi:hypothetical protein